MKVSMVRYGKATSRRVLHWHHSIPSLTLSSSQWWRAKGSWKHGAWEQLFLITMRHLYSHHTNAGIIWNTYFNGKSAYKKLLIPQNDLKVGTLYHKWYVGNSPEFMPLDNRVNYDLKLSHRYHCAVTSHLPNNGPRKYTLTTSKRITEGIKNGNILLVHRIPSG